MVTLACPIAIGLVTGLCLGRSGTEPIGSSLPWVLANEVKPGVAFESELWLEEGVPVFRSTTSLLTFRDEPRRGARTMGTLRLQPGAELKYDLFRLRTLLPGRVIAESDGVLQGRDYGQITYLSKTVYYEGPTKPVTLRYRKGDQIAFLQYRAEGEAFVNIGGAVIAIDNCPWLAKDSRFTVAAMPAYEEWIRSVDGAGRPIGWILVDGKCVVETDRRF